MCVHTHVYIVCENHKDYFLYTHIPQKTTTLFQPTSYKTFLDCSKLKSPPPSKHIEVDSECSSSNSSASQTLRSVHSLAIAGNHRKG